MHSLGSGLHLGILNPTFFGTTSTWLAFTLRITIWIGMYPILTSCVRRGENEPRSSRQTWILLHVAKTARQQKLLAYKFKVSPETLVCAFGGLYEFLRYFYCTCVSHFVTLFLHSLFFFPVRAGVQRQSLIRKSVTWRRPGRVPWHPPHVGGNDMSSWFGRISSETHWNIIICTGLFFEVFFGKTMFSYYSNYHY